MSAGMSKPGAVRQAPASVKPQPLPKGMSIDTKTTDSAISKAESEYTRLMRQGVPMAKAKAQVTKKTGIYPNGATN